MGPIVINLTAIQQSLSNATTSTTNTTATTTNITTVTKYTTTNTVINNAKILKMLSNSFNTNFPSTAVLRVNESGEVVVAVGTNVILNANSVIHIGFSGTPNVDAGSETATSKVTPTSTNATLRILITDSAIDSLTYDDSTLTTADGTTTNFKVDGFRTLRISETVSQVNNTASAVVTYTATLTGAGEGTISNKDAVIKGVVVLSVSIVGNGI